MRRLTVCAALLALGVLTPGCSSKSPKLPATPPAPVATDTLLSKLGRSIPLDRAVRSISFRPYIPANGQIVDVALISPLSGADTPKTVGIAFEYAAGGRAMVLQEWPLGSVRLTVGQRELAAAPCVPAKFKDAGLMWATPHRLVMALQGDGNIKPPRISSEARRLMSHGACS